MCAAVARFARDQARPQDALAVLCGRAASYLLVRLFIPLSFFRSIFLCVICSFVSYPFLRVCLHFCLVSILPFFCFVIPRRPSVFFMSFFLTFLLGLEETMHVTATAAF